MAELMYLAVLDPEAALDDAQHRIDDMHALDAGVQFRLAFRHGGTHHPVAHVAPGPDEPLLAGGRKRLVDAHEQVGVAEAHAVALTGPVEPCREPLSIAGVIE